MMSQVISGLQASRSHDALAPAGRALMRRIRRRRRAADVDELELSRIEMRPERLDLVGFVQRHHASGQLRRRRLRLRRTREQRDHDAGGEDATQCRARRRCCTCDEHHRIARGSEIWTKCSLKGRPGCLGFQAPAGPTALPELVKSTLPYSRICRASAPNQALLAGSLPGCPRRRRSAALHGVPHAAGRHEVWRRRGARLSATAARRAG